MTGFRFDGQVACDLRKVVQAGNVGGLGKLLADRPDLATARLEDGNGGSYTALHLAVEWPGHYPSGPRVVQRLLFAGADPDAPCEGGHPETPLHWAASTDDVAVIDALAGAGANMEASGAAVAGGTALDNAVGYGCWLAGHRLVQLGAQVTKVWHAAALGMPDRLDELLKLRRYANEDVNLALWHACRGGQRRTIELLLALGADLCWHPDYDGRSAREVLCAVDTRRTGLAEWLRATGGAAYDWTPE